MDAWGDWQERGSAESHIRTTRSFAEATGQMVSTYASDVGGTDNQTVSYLYDAFGNLERQTVDEFVFTTNRNNVETYLYDDLHRLTQSARTGRSAISYSYDAVGNLLSKTDYATGYQYSGSKPNAVSSVNLAAGGSLTFAYDSNGNRTHENGSQKIWYDAANKPTQISRNGSTVSFRYGADRMRFKKTVAQSGSTEITVYIDKFYERVTGGSTVTERTYLDDVAVLTEATSGSTVVQEIAFTHRDRLGSLTATFDADGAITESHSFDPFGKPRAGDLLDKTSDTLASAYGNRGFTDHEHLDDVRLIHMNGRAYDYQLGRFLSVDPFIQAPADSQSVNPYSYIGNNPLAGTDPTGYEAQCTTGTRIEGNSVPFCTPIGGSRKRSTDSKDSGTNGVAVPSGGPSSEAVGEVNSADQRSNLDRSTESRGGLGQLPGYGGFYVDSGPPLTEVESREFLDSYGRGSVIGAAAGQ